MVLMRTISRGTPGPGSICYDIPLAKGYVLNRGCNGYGIAPAFVHGNRPVDRLGCLQLYIRRSLGQDSFTRGLLSSVNILVRASPRFSSVLHVHNEETLCVRQESIPPVGYA